MEHVNKYPHIHSDTDLYLRQVRMLVAVLLSAISVLYTAILFQYCEVYYTAFQYTQWFQYILLIFPNANGRFLWHARWSLIVFSNLLLLYQQTELKSCCFTVADVHNVTWHQLNLWLKRIRRKREKSPLPHLKKTTKKTKRSNFILQFEYLF